MKRVIHSLGALAVLASCAWSYPALGQDDRTDSEQRRPQQQSRQQQQARQQQVQDRQAGEQQGQMALRPRGWVSVGIDYDQDRQFDAFETIYYYDLVNAQRRSAQRRAAQGRMQDQRSGQQMSQRQRQQLRRVTGEVTALKTIRLNGQQHRLAKLETQSGQRIPVDLGQADQLQQLNLQEGDQITVLGTRARINDRSVLCARRIEADDQTIDVQRQGTRGLRRISGEITDLRTRRFRDRDQQFQVAQVRTRNNKTQTVILGPQQALADADLQEGDQVQMLARPATLNGQRAMVAGQIRANGQMVQLSRRSDQSFVTSREQQRQRQQQRQQQSNRTRQQY